MMQSGKTILIFTDWYEPGYKAGGPIQSCRNFVAAFKEEYQIRILTSDRDQGETQAYAGIAVNSWIVREEGVAVYYAGPGQLNAASLQRLVGEVRPDHIYLNSMFSLRYTLLPLWLKWRGRISCPVVIAPRGMLHEGALKFKPAKKKLFIRLMNLTGLPARLTFQATDEQEVRDIRRWFATAGDIRLVPNFVNTVKVEWKEVVKASGELRGVFVSRVAPKKNLLFFLDLLRELPGNLRFHLDIYGDIEDEEYAGKCREVIASLPGHVTAGWKGAIPNHRVVGVLQDYHVFVLPTLGENFGHAIFEALLAGKPVLISDKTPWRDLTESRMGYDLPLETGRFRSAVEALAQMEQTEYNTWSRSAFEYAGSMQSPAALKEKYRELFP